MNLSGPPLFKFSLVGTLWSCCQSWSLERSPRKKHGIPLSFMVIAAHDYPQLWCQEREDLHHWGTKFKWELLRCVPYRCGIGVFRNTRQPGNQDCLQVLKLWSQDLDHSRDDHKPPHPLPWPKTFHPLLEIFGNLLYIFSWGKWDSQSLKDWIYMCGMQTFWPGLSKRPIKKQFSWENHVKMAAGTKLCILRGSSGKNSMMTSIALI